MDDELKNRLANIDQIVEYLDAIETASLKETHAMFLGRITILEYQKALQLGLDKGSFELNDRCQLTLPEPK